MPLLDKPTKLLDLDHNDYRTVLNSGYDDDLVAPALFIVISAFDTSFFTLSLGEGEHGGQLVDIRIDEDGKPILTICDYRFIKHEKPSSLTLDAVTERPAITINLESLEVQTYSDSDRQAWIDERSKT